MASMLLTPFVVNGTFVVNGSYIRTLQCVSEVSFVLPYLAYFSYLLNSPDESNSIPWLLKWIW